MSQKKTYSIGDIRELFNKELPKFIGLKNDQGAWEVMRNNPAIPAKKKMAEIEKHIARDSTPDGCYYFVMKDSQLTNAPERVFIVVKGTPPAQIKEAPSVTTVQTVVAENVWDTQTAVEKLTEINRLAMENDLLRKENTELNRQLLDKQAMAEDEEEDGATDMSGFMKEARGLIEMLMPAWDKQVEVKEKQLALKARQLDLMERKGLPASTGGKRTDGGAEVTDRDYETYFLNVRSKGTDAQFEKECNYLEQADAAKYAKFVEMGYIEVEEEEEEEPEKEANNG